MISKENERLFTCPSAMDIDAYQLGISKNEPAMKAHIDSCATCAGRLRDREMDVSHFMGSIFEKSVDSVVKGVQAEQKKHDWGGRAAMWSVAAAAGIALLLGVLFTTSNEGDSDEYIGTKGAAGVEIWCRRGENVFRVQQNDTLQPDDMLRFVPRFESEKGAYVMVVSVDGDRQVSRYFPHHENQAAFVRSRRPLPGSTILDDTEGAERIWLLVGDTPFEFEQVADAAASELDRNDDVSQMGRLPIPQSQVSVLVYKKVPK